MGAKYVSLSTGRLQHAISDLKLCLKGFYGAQIILDDIIRSP